MTKRERLSFALRRLRMVKAQNDIARRIQEAHEIIKEMIAELTSGTKNDDLGQHTIQLLDELYAVNTGAIENGRLPVPPVMPDCADQIHAPYVQGAQSEPVEHKLYAQDTQYRSVFIRLVRVLTFVMLPLISML